MTGIEYWEEEDVPSKDLKEVGYTIFPCGDGTDYAVSPYAPEEAHFLASGASQGDPESIKMIEGVEEIVSGDHNISTELLEWNCAVEERVFRCMSDLPEDASSSQIVADPILSKWMTRFDP
jgi:hypothetical protein